MKLTVGASEADPQTIVPRRSPQPARTVSRSSGAERSGTRMTGSGENRVISTPQTISIPSSRDDAGPYGDQLYSGRLRRARRRAKLNPDGGRRILEPRDRLDGHRKSRERRHLNHHVDSLYSRSDSGGDFVATHRLARRFTQGGKDPVDLCFFRFAIMDHHRDPCSSTRGRSLTRIKSRAGHVKPLARKTTESRCVKQSVVLNCELLILPLDSLSAVGLGSGLVKKPGRDNLKPIVQEAPVAVPSGRCLGVAVERRKAWLSAS
jgi:hypothetical protein